MKRLYIFGHSIFISKETQVEANSYEIQKKLIAIIAIGGVFTILTNWRTHEYKIKRT